MRHGLKGLLLVAASLWSALSFGSPLQYDEATDGDLPYLDSRATQILPFDLGNNTIKGTVTLSGDWPGIVRVRDDDTFGFTVPLNASVQHMRVSFGPWPYPYILSRMITLWDRESPYPGTLLDGFSFNVYQGEACNCDSPNPSDIFSSYWPQLVPGHSYSVIISGGVWEPPGGEVPYEFSILITSVLEPGALLQQLHDDVTGPPRIGPGTSLGDKIALAQAYYAVPDIQATCAVLDDFINQVGVLLRVKYDRGATEQLIADAEAIKTAISCPAE